MTASGPGPTGIAHLQRDELWRIFDLRKESLQAIGKAQGRYVNASLVFLTLLWSVHFTPDVIPQGASLEILGLPIGREGLWMVSPAVLTVLSLGLIGTLNAMGPAWGRIERVGRALNVNFFWADLDVHRNIIDYGVLLRIWPEGAAEPVDPPSDPTRRHHMSVFSYPALLAGSAATTWIANYAGSTPAVKAYIYACFGVQALYAVRPWYRAVCRFLGVRRPQTEV